MTLLADIFRLLGDPARIRILMLLDKQELCVCQLTEALSMGQPLVSHNLALLRRAGFIGVRKDGKMAFYKSTKVLPKPKKCLMKVLKECSRNNAILRKDLKSLKACSAMQKETGKCDADKSAKVLKNRRRDKK
jgi:ArsR family transcriptional regulator, arsenate/arsenite/antimonite-responsive transcriptional repressor